MATDATVSIGADLTELRRELAKLPNLSASAAQKTLIQIEKVVQKAEKAVKASNKAAAKSAKAGFDKSAKALRNFGDKAGDADSALKDLAGALGIVSPELDTFLSRVGDLSGGVEGVTKLNTRLGLSLSKVAMVVAPLALLVAGIAAGWALYARRQAEAAKESALQKTILESLVPLSRALEEVRLDLAVATGDLTAAERGLTKVRDAAHEGYLKSTKVLRAEIATRRLELNTLRADIDAMSGDVTEGGIFPVLAVLAGFEPVTLTVDPKGEATKQAKKLAAALVLLDAQLATAIGNTDAAVDAHVELAKRLDDEAAKVERLRRQRELSAKADALAIEQASAMARIQSVIISGLSDADQAVVGLLRQMSDLTDDIRRFPDLTDAATAALKVLEEQVLALGDASDEGGEELETLAERIERLAPSPTVLKELKETLLIAQVAIAFLGLAAGVTSEDIARLEARIASLSKVDTPDTPDDDDGVGFWQRLAIAAEAAVGGVRKAVGAMRSILDGLTGAISGAIGLFDKLLQTAAGFGLADIVGIAREGGGASEVTALVDDAVDAIDVLVASAPEVAAAFGAALGGLIDSALGSLDPLIAAALDLAESVVDTVISRLGAAGDTIAPLIVKVLKKVVALALPLLEALIPGLAAVVVSVVEKLPALLGPFLEKLPALIGQAFEAAGAVTSAVAAVVDDFVLLIIAAIPELIEEITTGAAGLATTVTETLIAELLPKLPMIVGELVRLMMFEIPILAVRLIASSLALAADAIDRLLKTAFDRLAQFFNDVRTELRPGEQTTQTFGDTPGAVKVGLEGLRARFAPGDTVVAAQDPNEVLRQAEQAAGGSRAPARVVLDLRDGHLAFDRLFRSNIRGGGALAALNPAAVGRVKVYG